MGLGPKSCNMASSPAGTYSSSGFIITAHKRLLAGLGDDSRELYEGLSRAYFCAYLPKAQNGPRALCSMVLGPKNLNI